MKISNLPRHMIVALVSFIALFLAGCGGGGGSTGGGTPDTPAEVLRLAKYSMTQQSATAPFTGTIGMLDGVLWAQTADDFDGDPLWTQYGDSGSDINGERESLLVAAGMTIYPLNQIVKPKGSYPVLPGYTSCTQIEKAGLVTIGACTSPEGTSPVAWYENEGQQIAFDVNANLARESVPYRVYSLLRIRVDQKTLNTGQTVPYYRVVVGEAERLDRTPTSFARGMVSGSFMAPPR